MSDLKTLARDMLREQIGDAATDYIEKLEAENAALILAIQATEARMSAAVEALEAVLPFTRAEELAEAAQVRLRKSDRNPVHKAVTKARQALAEIRSVTNG